MPRVAWSIATAGTVVVVVDVVVVVLTVAIGFAVVAVTGTVVAVGTSSTFFLLTLGAIVVAAMANVVVTIWVLIMGRSFTMVVFKLALPWNTERIFFDSALSRSGTITAASSII